MARFIEEEDKTEEVVNEPSSETQIYTMKSQIGHERTCLLYTSDAADE